MKEARVDAAGGPVALERHWAGPLSDYVALTKPRLNLLVVVTSAAGYYLGGVGSPAILSMLQVALGTALVAGGAAVLNQVLERRTDALMRRTRTRPLPDGRIAPGDAGMFGGVLAAAGLTLLAVASVLAAVLALATLIVYVAIYTPMKRQSSLATLVGAVPGALPPLIGWTAAEGTASIGGWVLFAIVFLWQIPHFMAIAWIHRDDYARAGFPMLPVIEPEGRRTGRQAVLYAAALLPVSLLPTIVGIAGRSYFWVALVLGAVLLWLSGRFASTRSDRAARALFYASIVYLPLVWAAMVLDRWA